MRDCWLSENMAFMEKWCTTLLASINHACTDFGSRERRMILHTVTAELLCISSPLRDTKAHKLAVRCAEYADAVSHVQLAMLLL